MERKISSPSTRPRYRHECFDRTGDMSTIIEALRNDITKIGVDAVVNAANTSLLGGGGVDGAIHRAAGPQLLEECRRLGGCKTGEARITKGYGLPAKHVIHTVGPIWTGGLSGEEELLASCYKNSLEIARTNALKSLAFPSISTGTNGFPVEKAAGIAVNSVQLFVSANPRVLEKVIFVLFSDHDLLAYDALLGETNR